MILQTDRYGTCFWPTCQWIPFPQILWQVHFIDCPETGYLLLVHFPNARVPVHQIVLILQGLWADMSLLRCQEDVNMEMGLIFNNMGFGSCEHQIQCIPNLSNMKQKETKGAQCQQDITRHTAIKESKQKIWVDMGMQALSWGLLSSARPCQQYKWTVMTLSRG